MEVNMKTRFAIIIITLFVLAGCVSGVKRLPAEQTEVRPHVGLSANKQVSSVSISLTDDARKKALDNLKFNPDELLSYVKRALDANSLVSKTDDKTRPSLEVQIKNMRIRSNFTAVMWGVMAGADSILGDVVLKDPANKELDRFEVSVAYALGGMAGGQDSTRMGWLYEKFAEETVKELMKQ